MLPLFALTVAPTLSAIIALRTQAVRSIRVRNFFHFAWHIEPVNGALKASHNEIGCHIKTNELPTKQLPPYPTAPRCMSMPS